MAAKNGKHELVAVNQAYEVPTFLPDVIVFGSNGSGEAFAFPIGERVVVQVPFLPLAAKYARRREIDFTEFLWSLRTSGDSLEYNAASVGMEVHDRHPICLGGSPTDPENKVLVPVVKHAEICRFWNRVYCEAVARQSAG